MEGLPTLYFLLAIYGIANAVAVVKEGKVGQLLSFGIPPLAEMMKCPVCVSFWLAVPASYFVFSPALAVVAGPHIAAAMDAGAAAGFAYLVHVTAERIAPDWL